MTTTNENDKCCLECGEPLGAGRSDRKFCNDICRTAFNNRRRGMPVAEPEPEEKKDLRDKREEQDWKQIKKIQKALLENRIRLMNLLSFYDSPVAINDFYGSGVNLKYFTSEYQDEDRNLVFRMCFDHGYCIDGPRVYLIYHPNEIYTLL